MKGRPLIRLYFLNSWPTIGQSMTTHRTAAQRHRNSFVSRHFSRQTAAIVMLVLTAIGFGINGYLETSESQAVTGNAPRIPIANPTLEPDRPDLIGEPRPDE